MPVALPYNLNASALRIWMPTRASGLALGLEMGGSSTPESFSRRSGVPSVCSAYIGWKQPAPGAARTAIASTRSANRALAPVLAQVLANDIDDPHGNHDHLADFLAAQRQLYRIKGQSGSLNLRILGVPWHSNITPFLAVDLNDKRHGV